MRTLRIALVFGIATLIAASLAEYAQKPAETKKPIPTPAGPGPAAPQAAKPAETSAEVREMDADLDALARDIAASLGEPGYRQSLLAQFKNSKKREKILRLDEFTGYAAKKKDLPAKANAAGLDKKVAATMEKFRGPKFLQVLGSADIDFYFPVAIHRDNWKGDSDFLVAYSPVEDEGSVKELVAYSVKTGARTVLDAKNPPATPVVAVAVCEHATHDDEGALPQETLPESKEQQDTKKKHNSYFAMSYIKVYQDQEPWIKGDPEVYLLIGHVCSGQPKCSHLELARVNNEKEWCWIRDIGEFYFDDKCSNETMVAIMERDGDSKCDYTSNVYKYIESRLRCAPWSGCDLRTVRLPFHQDDDPIYPPDTLWSWGVISKAGIPWSQHSYLAGDPAPFRDTRYAEAKFYKRP